MNYGLYLSASGVLTSMYRQDVLANNLANAQTVGFKRDVPEVRHREAEAVEGVGSSEFRNRLLDRIGGGALAGMQRVSLEQGSLQSTGNPLDAALTEKNSFFAVGINDSRTGRMKVQLTRDGRFAVNSSGKLVTAAGGHEVLDTNDRPIVLRGDRPVQIQRDGRVVEGGQVVARLQVAGASDEGKLVKAGQNLLWFEGGADLRSPVVDGGIEPGHVEGSAVDPIRTLMDLTATATAASFNGNMIKYHDLLMDRAVNVFGRVG